jgi:hypothetical protein
LTDWKFEALSARADADRWRKLSRANEDRWKRLVTGVNSLQLSERDKQRLYSLGVYDLELNEGKVNE